MIAIKNHFHLSEPLDLLLPYLLFFSLFFIYAKLQARLLFLVSDILGIDEEIEWLASVIIGIVAIIIIYKFY